MKNRVITKVTRSVRVPDGGESEEAAWIVEFVREDGINWCYGIPHCAFVSRAAEYGIDPADVETLIDVVFGEMLLTDTGGAVSHDDPTFLYNTDEETARLHHLSRISSVKKAIQHDDPGNRLGDIKKYYLENFDANAYHAHRGIVSSLRERRVKTLEAGRK